MAVKIEQVTIPDIGDADEVEVIELCVAPGDQVAVDDSLIVIESDKASMDIPAPVAGVLKAFTVALGDAVVTGQHVADIEVAADGALAEPAGDAGSASGAGETAPEAVSSAAAGEAPAPRAAAASAIERHDVRLPDVGEATEVVVIELGVAVGDTVAAEQMLLVVESDKASMDIVAPVAGRVAELAVTEGDEVTEGVLLVVLEAAVAAAPAENAVPAPQVAPVPKTTPATGAAPAAAAGRAPGDGITPAPAPRRDASGLAPPPQRLPAPEQRPTLYAGPAVRRLARELGVDLNAVRGSGARGRIVKEDLQEHVKRRLSEPQSGGGSLPAVPAVDHARFGAVSQEALSRIMQRGASNLHASWLNVVHVTQHDEADVTELETFRRSLKPEGERRGTKITPLAFLMKACAHLLREFPRFNASLDEAVEHFVLKDYVNVGFAVDTPDGLIVPVVHNADQLGVWELAEAINELAAKARDKKLTPKDLQGGTFTISSLGAIGGTGFTPIVNAPQVAILGVARLDTKPRWNGTAFEPRQMLPLSLSYDHRAINGADAGRFVTTLCAVLADLRRLVL